MPPLSGVALLGEGHLLRIFCKPFTELKIQVITGAGRGCRDIVGICTLFWLERVADDRFSVASVLQNRANEPECWDGSPELFRGHGFGHC